MGHRYAGRTLRYQEWVDRRHAFLQRMKLNDLMTISRPSFSSRRLVADVERVWPGAFLEVVSVQRRPDFSSGRDRGHRPRQSEGGDRIAKQGWDNDHRLIRQRGWKCNGLRDVAEVRVQSSRMSALLSSDRTPSIGHPKARRRDPLLSRSFREPSASRPPIVRWSRPARWRDR